VTTLDTGTAATVAFVTQSAQRTLAQRTADLTLAGTAPAPSSVISYTSYMQALGNHS
jgi:hypothetical protein